MLVIPIARTSVRIYGREYPAGGAFELSTKKEGTCMMGRVV